MNILEVVKLCEKPKLYTPSTATMWTDQHISKKILQIHLDPDIDLGSRKAKTIEETANWILSKSERSGLRIADLGCGPGLYAERFAHRGHRVSGVDFSKTSIEYAQKSCSEKELNIDYLNGNYLELSLEESSFDVVTLIYTDFGVLLPDEQNRLLSQVYRILKPHGLFIFDVLNDNSIEDKLSPGSWECAQSGFWKEQPYIALSDSFLYETEKVILFQHVVITENNAAEVYRFWTHLFSHEKLSCLLESHSFRVLEFNNNLLPATGPWDGKNVTFTVAQKF